MSSFINKSVRAAIFNLLQEFTSGAQPEVIVVADLATVVGQARAELITEGKKHLTDAEFSLLVDFTLARTGENNNKVQKLSDKQITLLREYFAANLQTPTWGFPGLLARIGGTDGTKLTTIGIANYLYEARRNVEETRRAEYLKEEEAEALKAQALKEAEEAEEAARIQAIKDATPVRGSTLRLAIRPPVEGTTYNNCTFNNCTFNQ